MAFSATLHCLTGCALGEIAGMVIGTAIGLSDWGTVGLAVALAFLFGYTLTSLPLLRAGLALERRGADRAGLGHAQHRGHGDRRQRDHRSPSPARWRPGSATLLFWGTLSVALVIAGVFAYPVNRWLIARGKGHVAVHNTGIHGGPPTRVVAIIAAIAFVFGSVVLLAEAF